MLYLEDLHEGDRATLGPIEVSREDALDFARKYDPQPFHLDDEAAAAHPFFKRLAISGWQTCALAMRLIVDDMRAKDAQSLGSPGIDQIRWLRPVYPGDLLMLEAETLQVRRSRSRPGMGTVKRAWTMRNQDGEAVMTMEGMGLFAARGDVPG
jgi:acyl dehydratase